MAISPEIQLITTMRDELAATKAELAIVLPELKAARAVLRKSERALAQATTILGIVIIACHIESGARRWSAPVWDDALMVPGSPATWGAIVLVAGLFLTVGVLRNMQRCKSFGFWLAFAWFVAVAALQTTALIDDGINGKSNPLGLVLWLLVAYLLRLRYQHSRGKI